MSFKRWMLVTAVLAVLAAPPLKAETVEIVADEEVTDTPTPVSTPTTAPTETPTWTATPPPAATPTRTVTSTAVPVSPPTATPTVRPKSSLDAEEERQARREAEEDAAEEAKAAREAKRRQDALDAERAGPRTSGGSKTANVSRRITFEFMLRSGTVARKKSQVVRFGKVIGSPLTEDVSYTVPKSVYVKVRRDADVRKGDRWVFLRFGGPVRVGGTGRFLGTQVQHLAVGRVLEVQDNRCLVKLIQSFAPVRVGDEVKSYEDEITRWRQAKKIEKLPASEIACRVSGGDPVLDDYGMNDYVILSAGSLDGVVAGQVFQLRQKDSEPRWGGSAENPIGRVSVFIAGPNYSIAKVLMNSRPISIGTLAVYRP